MKSIKLGMVNRLQLLPFVEFGIFSWARITCTWPIRLLCHQLAAYFWQQYGNSMFIDQNIDICKRMIYMLYNKVVINALFIFEIYQHRLGSIHFNMNLIDLSA